MPVLRRTRCRPLCTAYVLLFTAFLLAGASPVRSQPAQRLETGFERDINRYRWIALARLEQSIAGWAVALQNRFTSDAFLLFEDRLSFRDENLLSWRAHRPLRPGVAAALRGRTGWFGQSRVFSQEVYAGLRYAPRPFLWIEPAAGLAWDRRPGVTVEGTAPLRLDSGPAYGFQLAFTPPPLDGYLLQLQADGSWQVINPRRGRMVRILSTAERAFEDLHLAAALDLSSFRRDAYQAVSFLNRGTPTDRRSETVEATTSDTLTATLRLDAPFYRAVRFTSRLDLTLNNRAIRTLRAPAEALFFDTDFNRRAVDVEAALLYEQPDLTARLALRRGAEVEHRRLTNRDDLPPGQAAQKTTLLQQADYDRGHLALLARTHAILHPRVILSLDGTASILRHDTPQVNADDRDELYHHAQLGLLLRLSRYLQADLKLLGTYYHTVYLQAERSAENNTQRSLRLRPTVQWTPSRSTRVRLSSEVRATYTVDDFVLPGRRPKDQSAREFRYDLGLERQFQGGLRLIADGSLSDLHLGRLLWDRFAEIPFDTLRTYSGWLRLQAGTRIVADVGLRFFIRRDFDRAATVRYNRVDAQGNLLRDETGAVLQTSITRPGRVWIEQLGPTCAVLWPMRQGATLRLDGWLYVQHVRRRLYGDLPEASAARIRAAGRRGTRTVIPNLALSIVWEF